MHNRVRPHRAELPTGSQVVTAANPLPDDLSKVIAEIVKVFNTLFNQIWHSWRTLMASTSKLICLVGPGRANVRGHLKLPVGGHESCPQVSTEMP